MPGTGTGLGCCDFCCSCCCGIRGTMPDRVHLTFQQKSPVFPANCNYLHGQVITLVRHEKQYTGTGTEPSDCTKWFQTPNTYQIPGTIITLRGWVWTCNCTTDPKSPNNASLGGFFDVAGVGTCQIPVQQPDKPEAITGTGTHAHWTCNPLDILYTFDDHLITNCPQCVFTVHLNE
jgi:hypothetical protein